MRHGKLAAFTLIMLCLGGAIWAYAGAANSTVGEASVALTPFGEAVLSGDATAEAGSAEMSAWIKTAQARCPPGQLLFLTSACGCNGACCACSPQAPYLDHCSCKCSPTASTTCRIGISAGRR